MWNNKDNRSAEKFSDRICYLVSLFGGDELAEYLGQDAVEVLKWANSETLADAPTRIDYSYFLAKNGEFSRDWIEQGIGDRYVSGTTEENEASIRDRQFQKKLAKDNALIEEQSSE